MHYARTRGGAEPELVRVSFTSPITGEERVCVRGKDTGAFGRACGSFQWTHAVRGLSELLLRFASWNGEGALPSLSGELGSNAAALDFALGKPPAWLREMFGVTLAGEPFARRLFLRSNSELAAAGPVTISVNPKLLTPQEITIVGLPRGGPLTWVAMSGEGPTDRNVNYAKEWERYFETGLLAEVSETLSAGSAYLRSPTQWYRERVAGDASLQTLLPRTTSLWHAHEENLFLSEQRGTRFFAGDGQRVLRDNPLKVALPVALSSCLTLFHFLRDEAKLPLDIDVCFPHGVELLKRMQSGAFESTPDLVVIGVAVAARYLSSPGGTEYVPLMILPGNSHRVVAPRTDMRSGRKLEGVYSFVNDEPSTATLYFEHLRRSKRVSKERSLCRHAEPHESFSQLASGDSEARAVLFFPYRALNEFFNNCVTIDAPSPGEEVRESVLFVHRKHPLAMLRALSLALRYAWHGMRDNPRRRKALVGSICKDASFRLAMNNFSGVPSETLALP